MAMPLVSLLLSRLVFVGLLLGAMGFLDRAMALQTPMRSKLDHRIQHIEYSAENVTRLNAANGFITTVIFAPGEKVVNYGSGYSTAWEFATADNQFFLKPKDKDGTTNLVVVTNKRIYSFDVYLVEKPTNATYKLTFSYPEDEHGIDEAKLEQSLLEGLLEQPDPNITTNPHLKNCDYTMNFGESVGSAQLAPLQVFDDGLFTYIKFRPNTDFPAIYWVSSDGEAIVNTHIEQDTLIVHGVYPEYRLRSGSDVVGLYNERFAQSVGKLSTRHEQALQDGTSVTGVARTIKE